MPLLALARSYHQVRLRSKHKHYISCTVADENDIPPSMFPFVATHKQVKAVSMKIILLMQYSFHFYYKSCDFETDQTQQL
jgi:hypothetical protein